MNKLTCSYLAAMDAAEAIESNMTTLAKHQLTMDHRAFAEVFQKPYWEYPPQNLCYRIERETGDIRLINSFDVDYDFGSFQLQIESVEADNSDIYAAMVQKYTALKTRQEAERLQAVEQRKAKLRDELARLEI
jgi:hypothetical protein